MKKNIAVIGCGYWGKNLIRNFYELNSLNAICDVDVKKLKSFQEKYPKINIYPNYKELLKWQGTSFVLRIPKLIVQFLYYFGKLSGNIFLQENTTKLLTDNIYSNNKIAEFIDLSYTLNDIKLDNSVEA